MNDAMNDQARREQPEDGPGAEHATEAADSRSSGSRDAAAQGATKKTGAKQDAQAAEQHGKPRHGYLDQGGSEATREMRDTARRRRDAEEKLQQHLIEAKDHIPNEHHHGHH